MKSSDKLGYNQSTKSMINLVKDTEIKKPKHELIGIYGGTFDPPHNGHLMVALAAHDTLKTKIHVLPVYIPTSKHPSSSAKHRFNMAEQMVKGHEGLVIDDCEYMRDAPSKSIDTLRELRKHYPNGSLCLVIGMDSLNTFTSWYEWENILKLAHLIVAQRPGYKVPETGLIADILKERMVKNNSELNETQAGKILFFHTMADLDISSTAIRAELATKKNSSMLHPEVLDYINKNHLYDSEDKKSTKEVDDEPYVKPF